MYLIAKNIVGLPNLLAWKFCWKAQFPIFSGESPETIWKLCLSTKFPHHEIGWNYGILRSDTVCNLQRQHGVHWSKVSTMCKNQTTQIVIFSIDTARRTKGASTFTPPIQNVYNIRHTTATTWILNLSTVESL